METVIEANGVEVHFRGCDALCGVNLSIPRGVVFALLGENGAGKTTFIRCLTGFQQPSSGTCRVLGLDPQKDALEIRRRVGYVSDAPALYDWMQVAEIGWFAASFYDAGYLERYRDAIANYELPTNRKIKHLSKGQRAKVALSLAIAHDPEILILDEPTSGLDPLVRREFLESMIDRVAAGRTVLLSSHQIAEVERVADQVAILHQGKFQIVDSLADLREDAKEITITVEDPLFALPQLDAPALVLSEQRDGRQIKMIARHVLPEQVAALEQWNGVVAVRVRPATLDELFAACVRGQRDSNRPTLRGTDHASIIAKA